MQNAEKESLKTLNAADEMRATADKLLAHFKKAISCNLSRRQSEAYHLAIASLKAVLDASVKETREKEESKIQEIEKNMEAKKCREEEKKEIGAAESAENTITTKMKDVNSASR